MNHCMGGCCHHVQLNLKQRIWIFARGLGFREVIITSFSGVPGGDTVAGGGEHTRSQACTASI